MLYFLVQFTRYYNTPGVNLLHQSKFDNYIMNLTRQLVGRLYSFRVLRKEESL